MEAAAEVSFRPQSGPQEEFLSCPADIAIYGGSAGSGKTYGLILESVRNHDVPGFGGVVFRRTSPELTGPGSIWEEGRSIYPNLGTCRESPNLEVRFRAGGLLQFLHLQHASDVTAHQSKQYALIIFDELTHFLASQFWYMVSRLRSTCGVRPYLRAATNPDPDSFVRKLIAWWIGDPDCAACQNGTCRQDDHGYPNPERSGVIRWFVRQGDTLIWGDTKEELLEHCDEGDEPLSLTFIAAKLDDNPALTRRDPGYRARLNKLPEVERERLLKGNWNIRPAAGKYVRETYFSKRWDGCVRGHCDIEHTHRPLPPLNIYTCSDLAVTEEDEDESPDPDYTEHGVIGIDPDGRWYALDWWSGRATPDVWIDKLIDKWQRWKPAGAIIEGGVIRRAVAPFLKTRMQERDTYCSIHWINAPRAQKSATKQGYKDASKRAKAMKGRSFQARAAQGMVLFPARGAWVDRVVQQCVSFPIGKDDAFDVLALFGLAVDKAFAAPPDPSVQEEATDRWDQAFKKKREGRGWKGA
jgi:hypothetical protein